MDKATRQMMNGAEQSMIRLVESKRLDKLDEEELVELHDRVRRARNKYSKLYRRQGAARVKKDASRGKASGSNRRTAAKAEVFEGALATVSRRLAKVADASARSLRAERLAAAGKGSGGKGSSGGKGKRKASGAGTGKAKGKGKAGAKKARTPDRERRTASTRAATKRKQAKRDKR